MSNSPSNSQTAFAVKHDRSERQDLLDIGQRCSLSTCNLVDFLPIKCSHCKAPYCQEHFQPDKHTCEKWDARAADRRALECPLCSTLIAIPPGEDPNVRMGQHVDECFAAAATGKTSAKSSSVPTCARARCEKKLWAPITCEKCRQKFCATHRHPASHSCLSTPSASNTALGKKPSTRIEPSPSTSSTDGPNAMSAKGAAAMAAFKRSMQNASTKVSSKVTAASQSSPSTSSKTSTPSKSKQPIAVTASSSQSSSSGSKNVFSSKDRRATAERKSQLRAMQERQRKGLLSATEQERLRALEAEMKDKDDCMIM